MSFLHAAFPVTLPFRRRTEHGSPRECRVSATAVPAGSVARGELADDDAAADAARRQLAPFDLAAELLDALAHAAQAQAVRPGARVAPDAVVEDRQVEAVLVEVEVDVDTPRLGVRDDVAHQLAQHAREGRPLDHAEPQVLLQ